MKIASPSAAATVFVVDDDPSIRVALSSLIRSVKLRVETFSSAKEFLRRGRPAAPACLILDIRLPGLNGLDSVYRMHTSFFMIGTDGLTD